MSRRGELVKHTCPDIDRLDQNSDRDSRWWRNFCKEEDTMEANAIFNDWKAELESLGDR
jgi:hypothetical protein